VGEPKLGSTVPPTEKPFAMEVTCVIAPMPKYAASMFSPVYEMRGTARRRSVPPVCSRRRVAAERSRLLGRERPHLAAPFFAPRPAHRGSLTPHMHVASSGEPVPCQ
jgi:hypothetical protein